MFDHELSYLIISSLTRVSGAIKGGMNGERSTRQMPGTGWVGMW
jgi:hypothetical protein